MIYVLLGMHKSGTTLIAKMLHKSGINMGDFNEKIDYDSGNTFERVQTKDLNKRILNCGDDFSLFVNNPIKSEVLDNHLQKKMREIISQNNQKYKNWGFKDPRTCLTYQVWKTQLPSHRIIFVYRHPLEVWSHYTKKLYLRSAVSRFWGSIQSWYIYNQEVFKHLDCRGESIITINYREMMNDNNYEFKRLEKFLNQKLYDGREGSLYRSRLNKKKNIAYEFISYILRNYFSKDIDSLFEKFEEMRQKEIKTLPS